MLELVLAISFAASCFMTGLIWFVQIVHYPLMGLVGDGESIAYAKHHQRCTTLVVAPVMLVELMSAAAASAMLLSGASEEGMAPLVHASLLALAVVWVSTFAVQVPLHAKLLSGKRSATIVSLVRTNWTRTIGWSVRSVLLAVVLFG